MLPASRTTRIPPHVRKSFEEFEADVGGIEEIVEALIALPADQVTETRIDRLPWVLCSREGFVGERRFRMLGGRDPHGAWLEILELHPL